MPKQLMPLSHLIAILSPPALILVFLDVYRGFRLFALMNCLFALVYCILFSGEQEVSLFLPVGSLPSLAGRLDSDSMTRISISGRVRP